MDDIKIVIGSWGSYNEANERALGSKWLDLADYDSWDEIVEELKREGFELDGIDEELFIQDIEGLPSGAANWDYVNPQNLFETLYESGVLSDEYQMKVLDAYLQVRNFDDFVNLVNKYGDRWDDGINVYEGYDWSDYGMEMFNAMGYDLGNADFLEDFIDFDGLGHYFGEDAVEEYDGGLIEIIR